MKSKSITFILIIGILIISLTGTGCSAPESIYTNLAGAEDDAQVVIRGTTGEDEYQVPLIDEYTYALVTIKFPHAEIHEGDSFKADINSDDIDSEGDNNALHISFTTADTTKWTHIIVTATATGSAQISFIEAPTGGVVGGTRLDVFNRDRNSVETSGMTSSSNTTANEITQDATAPTGGTEIHHWVLGSGKNKIGGGVREIEEFILRQNTLYSIRLTANANDIRGQLTLSWYEHTNR